MGPLKSLGEFSPMDLESVWLILQGSSVIDWRRVNLSSDAEAETFLGSHSFDLSNIGDLERIAFIKEQAVEYLRRNFDFPIPRPVERADMKELLQVASGKGHRQLCACAILKAMHIIHHVEARELLFSLPMSDQDLFRLVEARVYQLVGHMLSEGLPISEFVGGRKRRDAIYTKLLSKREAHASAIYDKLRFRIVTRTRDDILPVLLYLSQQLFPFNYVVPGESINTIFQFKSYCRSHPHLASQLKMLQQQAGDSLNLSDNRFSADDYSIIHFVVDLPVRVPEPVLAAAGDEARSLGPIVFGLCEFQIVDRETEDSNERGEASHARYKRRQREAVTNRLKLGTRPRKSRPSQAGKKPSSSTKK
jgi:uncharacterized protein (TIGR04552 family)